jgi:hypothetical protein
MENAAVSVGLNGEGVARGHGGGHPPQSGSSAGRLVRCGGRSVRARVGGYGKEENNACVRLKRVQNQTTGGGASVMGDTTRRQGEHGARHPTGRRRPDRGPAAARLYFGSGAPTRLTCGPQLSVGEGVRRERRGRTWAGPGRKRVARA